MKREEFEMLLNDTEKLLHMTAEEGRERLPSPIYQMMGFEQQNPHHCFDLWQHTIYTLASLSKKASSMLKVAAFFHDVGKPYVAFEKKGKLVFYGHAKKSAEVAAKLLADMGYSSTEVEEICFYIGHHDDFISWGLPDEDCSKKNKSLVEINLHNLEKHISKVEKSNSFKISFEHWKNLLALCSADISAQAEEVWEDGKMIDSKKHKLSKINNIEDELVYMYKIGKISHGRRSGKIKIHKQKQKKYDRIKE